MRSMRLAIAISLAWLAVIYAQAPTAPTNVHVHAALSAASTLCAPGSGTVRYVLSTATGSNNGTNWTNAYTSLTTAMSAASRGDTLCVGDGSYGAVSFNKATSGTSLMNVVKATGSDHGTDTGWSSSFGDGAATFTSWTFSTNYWNVDGSVGGGPGSWNSGHGFEISSTSSVLITYSGSVNHITMRHFHADSDRGSTFIAGVKGTTGTVSNITVSQCAITEVFGPIFHISNWSDATIEYCYLYWNKSTAAFHSELLSSIGTNARLTWRYNIFDRIEGTAVFAGVNDGSSADFAIYGNIFARATTTPLYYYCEGAGSSNNQTLTGLRFYNNTIVGITGTSVGSIEIQSGCGSTDNEIRNNIWYNNDANSFSIAGTHSHNYASDNIRTEGCTPACDKDSELLSGDTSGQNASGSPFVSYNADPLVANLQLANATNAGQSLSSPYATDMLGCTRGGDGTWDRGALEFGCGGGGGDLEPALFRALAWSPLRAIAGSKGHR